MTPYVILIDYSKTLASTIADKFNEELKVWHLLVTMICMAWFMSAQFSAAMQEIYEIREEVYSQQASQTEMIMQGLKRLGVPIRERVR